MNNHCKNCYKLAEKLKQKERECEELKEQNRIVITLNQETYEKLRNSELAVKFKDVIIEHKQKEFTRYRKALEEIEKEIRDFQCDNCEDYHCETCDMKDILVIINKAKS